MGLVHARPVVIPAARGAGTHITGSGMTQRYERVAGRRL